MVRPGSTKLKCKIVESVRLGRPSSIVGNPTTHRQNTDAQCGSNVVGAVLHALLRWCIGTASLMRCCWTHITHITWFMYQTCFIYVLLLDTPHMHYVIHAWIIHHVCAAVGHTVTYLTCITRFMNRYCIAYVLLLDTSHMHYAIYASVLYRLCAPVGHISHALRDLCTGTVSLMCCCWTHLTCFTWIMHQHCITYALLFDTPDTHYAIYADNGR